MLGFLFTLVLCLLSASATALPKDNIVVAAELRISGQAQNNSIERKLSEYLDDDDIMGANAFVDKLAVDGEVDEAERRMLEDRIWRTKTERTLDYARKIREAIRESDLETMRTYNARMQRLIAEPLDSQPSSPVVGTNSGKPETDVATPAEDPPRAELSDDENAADMIAGLMRRGEKAIANYNLIIAPKDQDSAIGMVDQLNALGDEGQTAAKTLGQKIVATYAALIERNIERGRLDKAHIFVERIKTVAERAGLPIDQVDSVSTRIDEISAIEEEHDRLLLHAARLRDQGQLVAPSESHALALAAKALKLDVNRAAADDMLDDIILRQRQRADQLIEAHRLRDGARQLERLAEALLDADVDRRALVTSARDRAASLFRQADLRDSERARQAAAATAAAAAAAAEDTEDGNSPLTFINPF